MSNGRQKLARAQQPALAQDAEWRESPWLRDVMERMEFALGKALADPKLTPSAWEEREDLSGYGEELLPSEKAERNYQALIDEAFDARWGVFWAWVNDA